MPSNLFEYQDMMHPMGLSPVAPDMVQCNDGSYDVVNGFAKPCLTKGGVKPTPVKGGAGGLLKSPNTGVVPPRLAPVVNLNCMPGPGKRRDFRCGYCNQTMNGKTYRCTY